MQLLLFFKDNGNITGANMNENSNWASLDIELEGFTYSISIHKEEKKK